jgi:hypothetical protein
MSFLAFEAKNKGPTHFGQLDAEFPNSNRGAKRYWFFQDNYSLWAGMQQSFVAGSRHRPAKLRSLDRQPPMAARRTSASPLHVSLTVRRGIVFSGVRDT